MNFKKINFLSISIVFLFFIGNTSYGGDNNIIKVLIEKTITIINKHMADFKILLETSGISIPNYNNIQLYAKTYYTGLAEKMDFDEHLTKDFIVGIHYRENHNNTEYSPYNGDGVFQLAGMYGKTKSGIYCTRPEQYQEIYKTCMGVGKCKDFTKQLVYQYCDYIQYMKHKFGPMNIQKKAIYGVQFGRTYVKGLKQMLEKIDINVDDELWKIYLNNINNYLEQNNIKTINFLDKDINFEFSENKYNIKDFKQFIQYLYNNYFKQIGIDNSDFIRVLLEVFQDSVVADYYNGLGANWGSWITKSYAMNIPKSFANLLGIDTYITKKPSGRGYMVNDAQVGAVIWYFYTKYPDYFKYIIIIQKLWLSERK